MARNRNGERESRSLDEYWSCVLLRQDIEDKDWNEGLVRKSGVAHSDQAEMHSDWVIMGNITWLYTQVFNEMIGEWSLTHSNDNCENGVLAR